MVSASAAFAQLDAGGFGPAVLPDDGVVDGQAGAAVPHHGGFALVGDADGAHVLGLNAGLEQHFAGGGQLGAPDFLRVVFHPAGLGVNLVEFALRLGHGAPARRQTRCCGNWRCPGPGRVGRSW